MRILFVEDLASDVELEERELIRAGLDVVSLRVETRETFLAALRDFAPDVILTDYKMPHLDGLTALHLVLERAPNVPVIITTGSMNEETAVACMKEGAFDYVLKENLRRLPGSVLAALEKRKLLLERRRSEEDLQRTQQLLLHSQKMEAVGRLAGGVAHDFNNLLTVIRGYAELLESALEDPKRREEVAEILKASERAAALTRQLLTFSHRQTVERRTLDLGVLVTDLEKMLRRLIGEDVLLTVRAPAGLGLVNADPGQIEQVVLNLAINARDAMPQGGELRIQLREEKVAEEQSGFHEIVPPGKYIVLSVSDTGVGMNAKVLSHIFEPFFTTKEKGKG
ncbi:MAG: sensor histidine kinase, partial [Thermoanaerobaculia bacterium]